jgi:hypothetical protein
MQTYFLFIANMLDLQCFEHALKYAEVGHCHLMGSTQVHKEQLLSACSSTPVHALGDISVHASLRSSTRTYFLFIANMLDLQERSSTPKLVTAI